MKIMIEMTPEHYDGILEKISQDSGVYGVLKNGVVDHRSEEGVDVRVILIVCDVPEAETLFNTAKELWPDAAFEIGNSIRTPRTFN